MYRKFLCTLWHFYLMLFFSTPLLFASIANGAMVNAQICASATIISVDPGFEVSGFPQQCTQVSGSAVALLPGEAVIFKDSASVDLAAGGFNPTNEILSYTIQYDWNWLIITSVSGPDETASALVQFSLLRGLEYTAGSGSDSRTFTNKVRGPIYIDWFGEIRATGYASSIMTVPEPAALWLMIAGLIGLLSVKKSIKKN